MQSISPKRYIDWLVFLFLIEVYLIYNAMLLSNVQQSDPDIYVNFLVFFSIIVYYKILNIIPYAISRTLLFVLYIMGFLGGSDGKESGGDWGSIPGSGKAPGKRNGYPLQCSCLENLMDRGAWRATVHRVARAGQD